MLLHIAINAVRTAVLSFVYRCRGGFLGTGSTQLARFIFWAAPIAISSSFIDWRVGWLCGLLAHLSLILPISHAQFQASSSLKNFFGMGLVCMERIAITLLPLIIMDSYWIALAIPVGILSGVAYSILGYKVIGNTDSGISTDGFTIPLINFPIQPGRFATSPSEWGEVFTGTTFGLAFMVADLLSKI